MSDAVAPRLRVIEAVPVEHEGEQYVALRDPSGYTPSVLMLAPALLEVVALFDGDHPIVDIQAALMQRHGELVTREHLEKLVAALDEHGFLESPAFAARRASIDQAFLAAPSRPASHAGGAYAGEAQALRGMMDGFFTSPDGPGAIRAFDWPGSGPGVRGLVAPHIDFHRGGPAYAWAYRELAERGDADLFVVFGTCHAGMADPFALTR
jgi:MEMO1 family protein